MKAKAVVIGASAGGLEALKRILVQLREDFQLPLLIVQHISAHSDNYITVHLNNLCRIRVKEAEEKEKLQKGTAYFAPPNFHMLVEEDQSISFTVDRKINYARPSIDVLFETAAYAFGPELIGIVLTGANKDGAEGLAKIKAFGGMAIAQDPDEAEVDIMPRAAIDLAQPNKIMKLDEIANWLNKTSA